MSDAPKEVSHEQYERIRAVLGMDAETFRRTKLGQNIFDTIERLEDQLVEDLIVEATKSSDPKLIQISLNIQMHRMLPKFIDEAIQSGHNAEQNLDQMDAAKAKDY